MQNQLQYEIQGIRIIIYQISKLKNSLYIILWKKNYEKLL